MLRDGSWPATATGRPTAAPTSTPTYAPTAVERQPPPQLQLDVPYDSSKSLSVEEQGAFYDLHAVHALSRATRVPTAAELRQARAARPAGRGHGGQQAAVTLRQLVIVAVASCALPARLLRLREQTDEWYLSGAAASSSAAAKGGPGAARRQRRLAAGVAARSSGVWAYVDCEPHTPEWSRAGGAALTTITTRRTGTTATKATTPLPPPPPPRRPLRAVELVPPSEYLRVGRVHHGPRARGCCDPTTPLADAAAGGPSSFFCATVSGRASDYGSHVARTLAAQYRFLPAMRHAVGTRVTRHTKWVVMVDDDSIVCRRTALPPSEELGFGTGLCVGYHTHALTLNASFANVHAHHTPRARAQVNVGGLLALLSEYNHLHAMQLGDFVPAPRLNATHWKRPFACGGAGTVLSRAAVLRTNWAACVYAFSGTCLQSDWMIGRCLEASRVTAVIGSGCGTCATPKGRLSPHTNKAEAVELPAAPSLRGCPAPA